ncbi:MAG TPA: cysteine desulfurase [Bacteroides sp.]|nr:cysteine desulfurase [Bacteroides sp.]
MALNVEKIRNDFPVLSRKVYDHPIAYFDNGATTQKPQQVIDTIRRYYEEDNASIHRGIHYLSEKSTETYEKARETVRKFLNASSTNEIVFTSGTTGSINAIAFSFGEQYVNKGDEVIISEMEHHANIVPWQMMCERKGAELKVIPFNEKGELILEEYEKLLSKKTRIVAITHISNTLGTINPVKEIIGMAHALKIPVLLDGAQAVQHENVDVQQLDADFYVFSGHKVYGPNGIGVLYGKEELLYEMPPYQGGGDMVDCVTFEKTTYNQLPFKFEAGTMNYIGAGGLATALDYITDLGIEDIREYEDSLLEYATGKLMSVPGIEIYGKAARKISILSFLINNIHPYDAGMVLDKLGIAVRTGTHCNQPVMDHFKITGTLRASLAFYNTKEEIDRLFEGLQRIIKMFG